MPALLHLTYYCPELQFQQCTVSVKKPCVYMRRLKLITSLDARKGIAVVEETEIQRPIKDRWLEVHTVQRREVQRKERCV